MMKNISSDIIRLATNEHYRSAISCITEEEVNDLLQQVEFNRYPTQSIYEGVEVLAAQLYDTDSSNVLLCNGSDEGIFLLMQQFAQPAVSSILLLSPSFSMYEHYANILGLRMHTLPLSPRYELSAASLIKYIEQHEVHVIFIPNPQAPTGGMLQQEQLLSILDATSATVVVDEAYIEFTNESSMITYTSTYDNLMVLRTLSKYYGMAALRVGFIISNYRSQLRAVQSPYAVNSLSALIAEKVLSSILNQKDRKYEAEKEEVYKNRCRIQAAFQRYDFVEVLPTSHTNFVYVETALAASLYEFLLSRKIVTKLFNLDKPALRITVPNEQDTQQFLKCVELFAKQL